MPATLVGPGPCGTGAGTLPRAALRVTDAVQPMALHQRRAKRTGSSPSKVTRCRRLLSEASTGATSAGSAHRADRRRHVSERLDVGQAGHDEPLLQQAIAMLIDEPNDHLTLPDNRDLHDHLS